MSEPLLITVPYYPEDPSEYINKYSFPPYTCVNWDDQGFIRELRTLLQPLESMPEVQLPKDRVTVAMHVRTGKGRDQKLWEYFTYSHPMKGPPASYFNDALSILLKMYDVPLYVYIFTDDPDPLELQNLFSQTFANQDIVFDCRQTENRHDRNVLEDFFAMGKFDCLIRTYSNYSFMASKIFPFKVVISPVRFQREPIRVDRILLEVLPLDGVGKHIRTEICL